MVGCGHGLSFPAASRDWSKSMPKKGSVAEKTKPMPDQWFGCCCQVFGASSKEHHVLGSVLLARRPLIWYGTFVGLPSRCSYRHTIHWSSSTKLSRTRIV